MDAISIRRRARDNDSNVLEAEDIDHPLIREPVKTKPPVIPALLYCIYLFCFGVILFTIALYFNDLLPKANYNPMNGFVANRAINDLQGLEKIGPKVTGSKENEVLAVEYLMTIIKQISKTAQPVHKFEIDLQKVSGSFSMGGLGLHYDNVQNIVVKVGPSNNASLLINCHFDSVPTSPGASDDGLNCAVMLEVLRVITSSSQPLSYGAIFLFNGAEENPLIASHGFITQHKWAREIKAFINLESCGAGGHEMLFQTGPKCPMLVEAYAEAVKYPVGNVIGEEIFQSGVLPSDTDFRIFRDYGHIPGLDFAHCLNGYVYHTNKDNINSIENMPGVIQHTGTNLLSMVLLFTGSNSKLPVINSTSEENSVYFDVLGKILISYSTNTAFFINLTSVLASLICVTTLLRTSRKRWVLFDIAMRSSVLLAALFLSLVYNLIIAAIMDIFSASMTWFTYTFFLVPLYVVPTLLITSFSISINHSYLMQKKQPNDSESSFTQFLSTQFFWTLILLLCMFLKLRSSFFFVMLVLPSAATFIWLKLFYRRNNVHFMNLIYLSSTCPASLTIIYFGIRILRLLIPMTGRAGPSINPDLPISILVTFLTFSFFSYLCCFSMYVKKIKSCFKYIVIFHIGLICALLFSNIGFPYSNSTPQRLLITDVTRNSTVSDEAFLWIEPLQRRGMSVHPTLATLPVVKPFCTETAPHCGLPWNSALLFMKRSAFLYSTSVSRWLPSSPNKYMDANQLEVISDEKLPDNIRVISFNISGPDRMTLLIHTPMTMTNWSIDNVLPKPVFTTPTGKSYVIRHVHGLTTPSWNVTFKFKINEDTKSGKNLHIDLIGHYMHGNAQMTANIQRVLAILPSWVHVIPSQATLKAYKF